MAKLTNKTKALVSIRLNNGRTVHLPPKFSLDEIDDALVTNNNQVKKLEERHVISVQSATEEIAPPRQLTKQKSASGKTARKSEKE